MERRDLDESGARKLASLLRDSAAETLDRDAAQTEWQRLLNATDREDLKNARRGRFSRLWLLVPAVACTAVLAIVFIHKARSPHLLRLQLDGSEPLAAYLSAEAEQPRRVDFSDGSSVVLRPSGRMRITGTHPHGAGLSLERGELDLSIRHRPSTHWQVVAGPYVVQITGTRFEVTWQPEEGKFRLKLSDGSVQVSGPGMTAPIALTMGQELRAATSGAYTITRQVATAPAEGGSMPDEVAPVEAPVPVGKIKHHATGMRSPEEKPSCDWTGLVSSGHFGVIVEQARAMGLKTALVECSSRSLFALADAARYLGEFDLSRRTLVSVSKRSADDAMKASFFLGRLEEARGNLAHALELYEKVLDSSHDRTYASEAREGRARVQSALGLPQSTSAAR